MSLVDDDARPIRKGSLATPTQFGYTAQVTDNRQGVVIDYEIEAGMPPDAPRLVPAVKRAIAAVGVVPKAVTADRGYGQSSVDNDLDQLGVDLVAILRKGKTSQKRQGVEAADEFVELVKWRTGSEGRIAALKRQHGWDRARIRGLVGARTWCGVGRALPQRDQDRRPHPLTGQHDNTTPATTKLIPRARTAAEAGLRSLPDPSADRDSYFFRTK